MESSKQINYMLNDDQIGGKNKKVIKKTPKAKKEPKEEIQYKEGESKNIINIDSIYKFIDLYFKQKNVMYAHLYNSFDKLLDEDIPTFLKGSDNIFFEKITADKIYRYKFKYENIAIKPPFIDMDDEIMFPQHARLRNLTYASKLVANITQIQEITDIATGIVTQKTTGTQEIEYPITNIPIMVRSKYCSLNIKKGYDKSECEYDPGGYFIVNGSEKVVMSLERMIENRPLVFIKKDSSTINYVVQTNSKSYKTDLMQTVSIKMKKNTTMTILVPILNEVPVFILMKALGVESDKDIINYCVYDHNDNDMINIIRLSLETAKSEKDSEKITTQLDALNYLTTHLRVIKKYNETDKDIRQKEKRLHLMQLLKDKFLLHIDGSLLDKAFYLGYMMNRLLQCFLGRIKPDDRDSYINKRVDLPGQLIMELFKQYYKKMLNECNKFFKRRNPDDVNPLNIINQIKPNIIEQGLKTALLTGAWGKKKGVAQMLQRLTYLQTLSSLRRINSPTVDASNNKLTSPRHLNFCYRN
jgi:DNA-directed RNA polymerase beta subunit